MISGFFTFRNAIAGLHMKESDKLPYIVAESTTLFVLAVSVPDIQYFSPIKLLTELCAPKLLSEVLILSQKLTVFFSFLFSFVFPFFLSVRGWSHKYNFGVLG